MGNPFYFARKKNSSSVSNAYLISVGVFTITVQSKSCKRLNPKFS